MHPILKPKDRDAILKSLQAGVVPKTGQQHIQVGRLNEIEAITKDLSIVADNGGMFRIVVGSYGSGKTFFLNLVKAIALEKKLVVASADLTPDKRLHATGGQTRALYAELMQNLATKTRPDGNALAGIVEKFIGNIVDAQEDSKAVSMLGIHKRLEVLTDFVGGFDFRTIITKYWEGHESGDDVLKQNALRWLRAEYTTKTEAKQDLGVRTIIDDKTAFDYLKLLAVFVKLAGYAGLLISLDEMVNLYKLANPQARNSNYEQILHILNDSLQNTSHGLGFIMGGTPDFLMDPRKGLYSYAALQTRLAENQFVKHGYQDYSGPIIRLVSLTEQELFLLLSKIRHVFANGNEAAYGLTDNEIKQFMQFCAKTIGEAYVKTPRNSIKAFVNLLSILSTNPEAINNLDTLIGKSELTDMPNNDNAQTDDLADFRL